jgi:hypothetical protein
MSAICPPLDFEFAAVLCTKNRDLSEVSDRICHLGVPFNQPPRPRLLSDSVQQLVTIQSIQAAAEAAESSIQSAAKKETFLL